MIQKKIYLQRDKNGGLNVSVSLAAIFTLFTLLGFIITPVVAFTTLSNRVDYVEESLEAIDIIELRLNSIEQSAVGTEVSISMIMDDIQEIKQDIKDLKKYFN
jgi:predicted PurR-regulated permease PerM